MNDTINVGMFEHVTKMGRIGGRHNSAHKPKAGPQFKHVPYSDQILMPTTPPRSSVTTPTSEHNRSKVIYKSDIDIREPISNVAVVAVNNTGKEPPRKKAFGNYEEMKLGRNMRAVPRGGVGGRASAAAANKDLIEMLNRNQLYHTPFDSRHNEPQGRARESENQYRDQTENVLIATDKDKTVIDTVETAKEEVDYDEHVIDSIEIKREYKTEMEHTRDLEPAMKETQMQESSHFAHGRVPNMPIFRSAPAPPSESMLYSREATSSLLATREATEQVPAMELSRQATEPFTPHSGGTSLASTLEVKDERSTVVTMVTAENNRQQQTTDDNLEIEEQINLENIATNSDGGKTDSDDFAF